MIALITLIAVTIIFVAIIALCSAGTISANPGIGIRIPSTKASEAAWKAGHKAAYPPSIIGGSITILIAGIGLGVPSFTETAATVVTILLVLTLAWAALRANQAAMRTAQS